MKHRIVKLALVLTLGLALSASGDVFAVNGGGGGTPPPGGGCSQAGDKSGCYDGCAFAYYEFTDSSRTATVAGISVNNCTDYRGFWFNHYKRTYGGALFGARTIGNCLSSNGGQMYEIGGNPGTGIESTVSISGARFAGGILSDISSARSKYQEYYNDNPSGMSPDSFFSSSYNYFCYDPAPAVVENNATFSGSISFSAPYGVSSLGGNSYRAASANTGYSFTPSYTVRRTDRNNPPSSARTQYAIGAYNYDNSISGWSTLTGFAPGGSQSFSGNSVSLSADWDSSSSACRYLSVADSKYRNDDFQSYTSYHAADYDCVTLYGPQSMRADFEGRIVISSDYGTVVNGDNSNTNASFTGTGFKTKYTFQVSYQLKRKTTSNDYPYAVPTNFDYSTSGYPSPTFSRSTNAMSAGNGYTAANSYVQPLTVTIEIGGADERACFYLSYDNQLTYRSGSTPYSTSHDGRVYKCLTIKNPKQAAELSYSATTVGSVDNHTDLTITNNGHNGELINQVVNSEGVYVDNFPAPKDYGVTFVHTLTRTDDPALTPTDDNDKRIAECANTTWRIYKQENGGAWTDTGKTRTECIKAKNGTVNITNKSSFEFTKNNMGTVVTYCEKLVYNNKISYEAHGHSVFDYGLTTSATTAETTPVCVRIANPAVEVSTIGDHVHKILVTPTIDGTSVAGASGSSPNYSATRHFRRQLHRAVSSLCHRSVRQRLQPLLLQSQRLYVQ